MHHNNRAAGYAFMYAQLHAKRNEQQQNDQKGIRMVAEQLKHEHREKHARHTSKKAADRRLIRLAAGPLNAQQRQNTRCRKVFQLQIMGD